MTYRNAYKTREGTINCEVLHPEFGWIPFHASPKDSVQHGRDLYEAMNKDPETHQETDEEYTERRSRLTRIRRDQLLTCNVDPILSNQVRFGEMTTAKQDEWKAYRRALLDLPTQTGFPHDIIWPTKPE